MANIPFLDERFSVQVVVWCLYGIKNKVMKYSALEYGECIEACLKCKAVCDHCAASCLREPHVEHMTRCIQLDLECAAICEAAATLMSLGSDHAHHICQLCADICNACADECSKHGNDHCRNCAEVCRKCAEECSAMAAA